MVMTMKSVATPSYNNTSACLLLALFLTSCLNVCFGSLTESVLEISRDDNATFPETTTPQGRVQGINMTTHNNRTVIGFLGIPYAQPPVGDLRFKAPVAPDAWNGTFDASSEAEACPQMVSGVVQGNEDCLRLNVFTPQLSASDNSTLLPVMVYVVGGGFKTGNNSIVRFGPDLLLDQDVVLVVPSFRLGVLGYLTTGDEVSPGNYGLKDIVQVLKWVQDSIQYFGGDPNLVTLFGGSSGAMSAHLLALSSSTDGLIHRLITQSGTALTNTMNQPREVCANRAIQLGENLGCPTNTSTLLVNCLRGFNVSQLLDTDSVFYTWKTYPMNAWLPTSEPDIEGALLTDSPANLIAAGKIRDIPWMASVTRDDGLNLFTMKLQDDPDLFDDFLNNIDITLPITIEYWNTDTDPYMTALKSYYFNDLTANRSSLATNLTDFAADGIFFYPVYHAFQRQLVLANNPHYLCSFEYRGVFSNTYSFSGGSTEYTEVAHGDEVLYLFETHDDRFGPSDYERSDADWVMVETMVQLWTSFATNGIPTTADSISTTTWEQYSSLNNYLRIGNGNDTALEMKYDLHLERMKFWDELMSAVSGEVLNSPQVLSMAFSLISCILYNLLL